MGWKLGLAGIVLLGSLFAADAVARDKPAPPPSRWGFALKIDEKSLPKGVTLRKVGDYKTPRYFIKNESDVPLIIDERFQDEKLVTGAKLVGGKVYHYFPNGVPMEGKTHLKGWQAPFGDIEETLLHLPKEPEKIYEGRQPGLGKVLPEPEAVTIPANYDGKPYKIKGTVTYHLNKAYDEFYGQKDEKDKE